MHFKFYKVYETKVLFDGSEKTKTLREMIIELIVINFILNLNVLKIWWLKCLSLITCYQPILCKYQGLQLSTHCEEFAAPNKKFCELHYRLERRFHDTYHFIRENGLSKYYEIGVLYGNKNYIWRSVQI